MADGQAALPTKDRGVFTALVYRTGSYSVVLEADDDGGGLEPLANVSPGGEWAEVNMVLDDAPPEPPGPGLWKFAWPWRRATPEELNSDEFLRTAYYEGEPAWTRVVVPGR